MQNTYLAKRARLENYFNEVSIDAWDKLTSNEPVSFVRQLVREGREKMQAAIIEKLPKDLRGARILDAGCGTGVLSRMLDERGAEVVGVDISEKLIEVATSINFSEISTPTTSAPLSSSIRESTPVPHPASNILAPLKSLGSFSIIAACIFSRPSLTNWRTKETGSFDVSLSQASMDTSLK